MFGHVRGEQRPVGQSVKTACKDFQLLIVQLSPSFNVGHANWQCLRHSRAKHIDGFTRCSSYWKLAVEGPLRPIKRAFGWIEVYGVNRLRDAGSKSLHRASGGHQLRHAKTGLGQRGLGCKPIVGQGQL
ncbi:hypothetical protein SAMN04488040_0050 [Sulfitobacter marinus]|uniref:Uncharacterized protein n=1 Tax=Sulfitobacter marinus TaxID=394264 RepID=A0A1I6VUD1_9RHOB|nr:hypothetical protein SAMN04488040_0050 [Sulfitobacter marinus]